MAHTPRALTLHLKRFRWMGRKVYKLDEHVPFPASLDIADFACTAAQAHRPLAAAATATAAAAAAASAAAKAAAASAAEEAAAVGVGAGASAPGVMLQTARKLLRLYGVVEHRGSFEGARPRPYAPTRNLVTVALTLALTPTLTVALGGHYVAFLRLDGGWFRMSDSRVTQVDEAAVLKAQAFLLFYERLDGNVYFG